MAAKRPDNQQMRLAFETEATGEARQGRPQEVEADMATSATEHPVNPTTGQLMEAICARHAKKTAPTNLVGAVMVTACPGRSPGSTTYRPRS